jgi:hypothetical protein
MKNFLYATLAVAMFSFAACSKVDPVDLIPPVKAIKKVLKSTAIRTVSNEENTYSTLYKYNSDGLLVVEDRFIFRKQSKDTIVTSFLYNYSPNLLTLKYKNTDGSLSTFFCYLNNKNLLTLDSTQEQELTYAYEYDLKNRLIKHDVIDKKTKNVKHSFLYTYQGDKLTEMKQTYQNTPDSRNEVITTYFYEKDIKNTLSNAARGMSFNGVGNLFSPTKEINIYYKYSINNGQLISSTQTETQYSYELDTNSLIIKNGIKTKTDQKPWSGETFATYEYEK